MIVNMSNIRKVPLITGETYHLYTRSIAGFEIFSTAESYQRLILALNYYNGAQIQQRMSDYIKLTPKAKEKFDNTVKNDPIVQIIAYCLMPTHIHLVVKQIKDRGISLFMSNVLNSYTRYFNTTHKRRGPLWESKFKNVLVKTDEQLLHLTRYLHLNPSSAGLISNPEEWRYSSYDEYLGLSPKISICNWGGTLDIIPIEYQKFVSGRVTYQRALSRIKHLLIVNYTG